MPRRAKIFALALAALLLMTFGVAQASASRAPTKAESKAIKAAFFKKHSKSTTKITRIRVSTVDKRYSSVSYATTVRDPVRPSAKAADTYKPVPDIFKKSTKWKAIPLSKTPKKIKKDLKPKAAKSDIHITGERTATLTRAARCGTNDGTASIYDPTSDTYLSIQFHNNAFKGPGFYPALSVNSVAGIYTNSATTLAYETGQPSDAFSPSGEIYVDGGGWGIIEADMARPPDEGGNYPLNVRVSGTWACG